MHLRPIMLLILVALLQGCGEEPQVSQEKKQQTQKAAVTPPEALPSISQTVPDNPFARPKQDAQAVMNAKSLSQKAGESDEEEAGNEFLPQATRQSAISLGNRKVRKTVDQVESTLDPEAAKYLPTGEVTKLKTEREGGADALPIVDVDIIERPQEESATDLPVEEEDAKVTEDNEKIDDTTDDTTDDTPSQDELPPALACIFPIKTELDKEIAYLLINANPPIGSLEECKTEKARLTQMLGGPGSLIPGR